MALTRLSVGKGIEVAFSDRQSTLISEAKVLLMRDGKDLESELNLRGVVLDDLAVYMQRDLVTGQVELIIKPSRLPQPLRQEWPSADRP